jgi:dTDP-glucose 4,6-dehydratase
MRVLLTGGAGFIGSNLTRLLVDRGHSILNVDKLTYAGNAHSLSGLPSDNHRLMRADVCDPQAMADAFSGFSPDWVIHLAAESHVDRSIEGPAAFIQTNIVGTYCLLEAARHYFQSLEKREKDAFRFLHVSTDEVYGSLGEAGFFTEAAPYAPRSPYSASKAASDHLARAWSTTYGLPVIVTASSNNYGPFQFPEKFVPLIILKALRGESIPIYGSGQNVRDWLHVQDHADALLAVVEKGVAGETYHIGSNQECRNIELAQLLCSHLEELSPPTNGKAYSDLIEFVADRPGHDYRYAIDATKIRRELGWAPKWNYVSGLRDTAQWYLDNREWWQRILEERYRLERLGRIS